MRPPARTVNAATRRATCVGAVLVVVFATACGIQASGGASVPRADFGDVGPYVGVALQTQNLRTDSSVIGVRTAIWHIDDAVQFRNVILGLGWDLHVGPSSPLGFETLAEIGAGGSAAPQFPGVGMYAGLALAPRVRVFGHHDRKPGYALIMANGELVLIPRAGMWFPPDSERYQKPYFELAGEIAFRISIGSDLLNGAPKSVATDPPVEEKKP